MASLQPKGWTLNISTVMDQSIIKNFKPQSNDYTKIVERYANYIEVGHNANEFLIELHRIAGSAAEISECGNADACAPQPLDETALCRLPAGTGAIDS